MSWRLLRRKSGGSCWTSSIEQAEQPVATPTTLVELFEAQVERTPEAMALSFGQQRLSYAELNRSGQPAGALSDGDREWDGSRWWGLRWSVRWRWWWRL